MNHHAFLTGWSKVDFVKDLPDTAGVYIIYSEIKCLYVGEAKNIKKRLSSPYHPLGVAKHLKLDTAIYFQSPLTDTRARLRLECLAIGILDPEWNFGATPKIEREIRLNSEYASPITNGNESVDLAEFIKSLTPEQQIKTVTSLDSTALETIHLFLGMRKDINL